MKKVLLLLVVILIGISCSTGGNRKCLEINKQLTSENRLLRSKISLLQRENSVYKRENIQYRKDVENRIAELEKLESEMASLKEKFRGDIALWEEKYSNLTRKNEILDRESSEKIQELTELNRQLEKRFGDEIQKLMQSIRAKDEEFGRDREQMKKLFAEDKFNLAKRLEDVKKNIGLLEKEKSEMGIRINEISLQLENAQREIEEKNSLIRELKKVAPREGVENPDGKGKDMKNHNQKKQ